MWHSEHKLRIGSSEQFRNAGSGSGMRSVYAEYTDRYSATLEIKKMMRRALTFLKPRQTSRPAASPCRDPSGTGGSRGSESEHVKHYGNGNPSGTGGSRGSVSEQRIKHKAGS
jgi:hypothetical protein